MAEDTPLKSSFELAMERLRQKDAAAGVVQRTLSDAEKAAIADLRSLYESKLAEQQVMLQSRLSQVFDPSAREALEAEVRGERERVSAVRYRRIVQIRAGQG